MAESPSTSLDQALTSTAAYLARWGGISSNVGDQSHCLGETLWVHGEDTDHNSNNINMNNNENDNNNGIYIYCDSI